jgi:inosose dehydratase
MSPSLSRRQFIISIGAAGVAPLIPRSGSAGPGEKPLLYPPVDLSYFDKPLTPAPFEVHFGYASITWEGNDDQAIKDVSECGFRGIQLRSPILKQYGDRPGALRELLDRYRLEMVALSSGDVRSEAATMADQVELHVRNARFVHEVGGRYLQLTGPPRPKNRQPVADDYKAAARALTEIAKRSVDLGVPVGYHNHMNTLSEGPEELDWVMDAADPRYVKLELDIAHYKQGGGDPAKAVVKYRDRILFLHIKDVESTPPAEGRDAKHSYRFLELGRGTVDIPAVFAALKQVNFSGWAVVELDRVPDKGRTPKECALISKRYIEEKLGLKV